VIELLDIGYYINEKVSVEQSATKGKENVKKQYTSFSKKITRCTAFRQYGKANK